MKQPVVGSYLLLLRGGGVWGVANEAVLGVGHRRQQRYHIQIASGGSATQLVADEVLGVVEGLRVWPTGDVLRRFWSENSRGMAVHGGSPIVVLDPDRPPQTLLLEDELEAMQVQEDEEGENSDERTN